MIRYYKVGMGCKREDITAGQISGRVNLSAENMVTIAIWRLMQVYSKNGLRMRVIKEVIINNNMDRW